MKLEPFSMQLMENRWCPVLLISNRSTPALQAKQLKFHSRHFFFLFFLFFFFFFFFF